MSKTNSKNFQWLELFLYYSLLWVLDIQPKCLIHSTYQQSNCQTLIFYSEKQNS